MAIRNFHRVLGIDLEHGVSVSGVKHEQILREVRTVLRRGRKTAESGVMLVHHGPQGIIFSQRVPVNCHFHGQSILFTSASLVEDLTVLGATASQAESPQEILAIRLFPDTACVYTMYRHRDDADTLVESFALARFDLEYAFPASGILEGANVWPGFLEWVTENLDQELSSCDVPPSLQEDIRTLMTAEQPNSWAAQLFEIMKRFPPLFGKEPRYPPTVDPWTAWTHGRRRCCFYSFEAQASAPRVARAIAALGIGGAQPAKAAIASNGIHGVCCPYTNLAEARKVAVAFRRRFGPLRLTIPHLGLNHREPGCDTNEGNGAWFGFARRGGVKVPA
ncbi:MAG: hypothetical protein NTY38_22560 [Acidobacteria bacterium]|nr:hypothetical protein [Acidobacteriota bacterium]